VLAPVSHLRLAVASHPARAVEPSCPSHDQPPRHAPYAPINPATLDPRPFFQYLERQNLERQPIDHARRGAVAIECPRPTPKSIKAAYAPVPTPPGRRLDRHA